LVHRADGGTHDAMNLALVCSRCHQSHHAGVLTITGTAAQLEVHRPGQAASASAVHDLPSSADSIAASGSAVASGGGQMDAMTSTMAKVGAHVCAVNEGPSAVETGARGAAAVTVADAGVGADAGTNDVHVEAILISRMNVDAADPAATTGPIASTNRYRSAADATSLVVGASVHVGGTSKLDAAILRTQAKAALTGLGWKPAIAHAAVTAAAAAQGADVTLERLIFESLRRCPVPKA
jgi:hypothetical protein